MQTFDKMSLTHLNHVISGTGFPVTLALNLTEPFSGTVCSWNRSVNSGGSGAPLGVSVNCQSDGVEIEFKSYS